MPCKDTTSRIQVSVGDDDRLLGFQFHKLTCSKEIAGGTGYEALVRQKTLDDILTLSFEEVLKPLKLKDMEDQFFLFLEWDALKIALLEFMGIDHDNDRERYKILSIDYLEDVTTINMNIGAPADMPKVLPCSAGDRD